MAGDSREGDAERRDGAAPNITTRAWMRRSCVAIVAALFICGICASLDDWLLAPFLGVYAALVWHTQRDLYATQPGFVIGFLLGLLVSGGIGPAAEIGTGLLCGAILAPFNAICRGFRGAGVAAPQRRWS